MVDLAQLAIEVDTRSVKAASSDLDKLSASAKATATSVSSLESNTSSAASATTQLGTAAASNVVPFAKATSAVNQATKAVNIQRVQMQQLSFQMNDIATGLLSGQSPFMIMAQQGGQVLQILQMGEGGVGGAIAKVGTALAAMATPANLAIGGLAAAGAAFLAYSAMSGEKLKATDDVLKTHKALIDEIRAAYGDATIAAVKYATDSRDVFGRRLSGDVTDLSDQVKLATKDLVNSITQIQAASKSGMGPRVVSGEYRDFADAIGVLRSSAASGLPDIRAFREAVAARMNVDPNNQGLQRLGNSLLDASDNALTISQRLEVARGTLDRFGSALDIVTGRADRYASAMRTIAGIALPEIGDEDALSAARRAAMSDAGGASDRARAAQAAAAAAQRIQDSRMPTPRSKPNLMDYNPSTGRTYSSESRSATGKAQNEAERQIKAYAELTRGAEQFVSQQQLSARTLGMSETATAKLRYEQELLNKAADQNIQLTPQQTAALKTYAGQMAEAETATSKLADAYNFEKQTFQGFFEDFRAGLAHGETGWASFASAAGNALDSIASKMLETVTSDAFNMLWGAAGGGASATGGLLKTILSFLGFADGGAFHQGHVMAFANGGIVTRPTIFPMARGMGLMGEAGPEAVMPLRRGADGKLGVAAGGAGGGGNVTAVTVDLRGTTGEAALDEKIRKAGEATFRAAVSASGQRVMPIIGQHQSQRRGDWRS